MEEKNTRYLPLGSVVLLQGGEKRLVIYGRRQRLKNDEKPEYDYIACPYPEGNISEEYTYLFNHENIKIVVHKGYTDWEDENFLIELSKFK